MPEAATSSYWSWWASGGALAALMLVHWAITGRSLSVSGRYTALVGWWRRRGGPAVDRAELLAAMRRATVEAFGEQAVADASPEPRPAAAPVAEPASTHLVFLSAVALGGLLSALSRPAAPVVPALRGDLFAALFPANPLAAGLVLLAGGVLVGFGTRMAGGCTSGHGLNGLSRLQPGSAVATAAFFGAGVGTSLLLAALL
jgi:hypothetical protein